MSFLTDADLDKIISDDINYSGDDKLIICPLSRESITPVGYDLRVGNAYATTGIKGIKTLSENESIILPPCSTTLITTLEDIQMPRNRFYFALIESKVSKVSKGLSHISTTVDPDWSGNLLIAIHNHSSQKISLKYGEKFCTIIFAKNESVPIKKGNHTQGRKDILINEFSKNNDDANKRRQIIVSIPPLIILLMSGLGYWLFGNNAGFSASVAVGVAIAQYVSSNLK